MDCCGLSSTGLRNIDANEITADNTTIFSNLNVSGATILHNITTLLSSINVGGSANLYSLNVSGNTNFNNVSINSFLYVSGNNILESLEHLNSSVSNLSELRADNIYTMIS